MQRPVLTAMSWETPMFLRKIKHSLSVGLMKASASFMPFAALKWRSSTTQMRFSELNSEHKKRHSKTDDRSAM